ncbi:unnamed protein product [Allacma fusca]|uniref:Calcium release-activated calcium channel protein 1 n=1 Tax=Allacma fusca TaxID=39272 RepID=A0A8J2KEA2_9HEXA|nr:unnamed protein product [Allacma fusca]
MEAGGDSFSPRKSSFASIAYDTHTAEYLSWRRLHLSKSKLSGVAEMASFMAGFAVVATVELQINDDGTSPYLLTAFVVTTSLLVATSMMTIMISTCILPQLDAVSKMSKCPSDEILRSPHDALIRFIDLSWILANTVSLFLFTLDVILVCWVKFTHFSLEASIAATAIMSPVLLIILIFGVIFYRKIIMHQYDIFSKRFLELEEMQRTIQLQLEMSSNSGTPDLDSSNFQSLYKRAVTFGKSPLPEFVGSPGPSRPLSVSGDNTKMSAKSFETPVVYDV